MDRSSILTDSMLAGQWLRPSTRISSCHIRLETFDGIAGFRICRLIVDVALPWQARCRARCSKSCKPRKRMYAWVGDFWPMVPGMSSKRFKSVGFGMTSAAAADSRNVFGVTKCCTRVFFVARRIPVSRTGLVAACVSPFLFVRFKRTNDHGCTAPRSPCGSLDRVG